MWNLPSDLNLGNYGLSSRPFKKCHQHCVSLRMLVARCSAAPVSCWGPPPPWLSLQWIRKLKKSPYPNHWPSHLYSVCWDTCSWVWGVWCCSEQGNKCQLHIIGCGQARGAGELGNPWELRGSKQWRMRTRWACVLGGEEEFKHRCFW